MSRANPLYTLDAGGRPIPASADEILAVAREQMSRGKPSSATPPR